MVWLVVSFGGKEGEMRQCFTPYITQEELFMCLLF
jgi:hypothetical protein